MSFATDINRRTFLAASFTAALGAYAAQHVLGQTVLSSAKCVVVETKYGRVRAQGHAWTPATDGRKRPVMFQ